MESFTSKYNLSLARETEKETRERKRIKNAWMDRLPLTVESIETTTKTHVNCFLHMYYYSLRPSQHTSNAFFLVSFFFFFFISLHLTWRQFLFNTQPTSSFTHSTCLHTRWQVPSVLTLSFFFAPSPRAISATGIYQIIQHCQLDEHKSLANTLELKRCLEYLLTLSLSLALPVTHETWKRCNLHSNNLCPSTHHCVWLFYHRHLFNPSN